MIKDELFNIIDDLVQDCYNDCFEYEDLDEEKAKTIYNNVKLFSLKLKDKITDEIYTNNSIYDNGCMVLGQVYFVKEYICKNTDNFDEVKDLINDLEDLNATDIVAINYDNGMGYSFDWWKQKDKIEVE